MRGLICNLKQSFKINNTNISECLYSTMYGQYIYIFVTVCSLQRGQRLPDGCDAIRHYVLPSEPMRAKEGVKLSRAG